METVKEFEAQVREAVKDKATVFYSELNSDRDATYFDVTVLYKGDKYSFNKKFSDNKVSYVVLIIARYYERFTGAFYYVDEEICETETFEEAIQEMLK